MIGQTFLVTRREWLRTMAVSGTAAALGHRTVAGAQTPDQPLSHVTLKNGDLIAVVGDNSAAGDHRAGYNGVWSLRHAASSHNVFVPRVAGLNLEHIVTGEHLDDTTIFFEPRNAPMTLEPISSSEAELHQPPTPTFHVESWTRFRLVAPHYLDMDFRCVPRQPVFPRGYLALFWASYINAPEDKSMYFLGGLDGQQNLWTQLCTQWHDDQSTVRGRDDSFEMTFSDGSRDALSKNLSRLRFDQPFFYGHVDGLVWQVMFDRMSGIRFTHSPSGGGTHAARQTTNPAWDFQFVIDRPQVDREYSFHLRTLLRPRCPRDELLAEFQRWNAGEGRSDG